jgi:hypothetical protein
VPLASAEEVFATASRLLGAHLPRIPDGEVGRPWMAWFAPIITDNPALERTDEEFRPHPGGMPSFRYRLAFNPKTCASPACTTRRSRSRATASSSA